MPVFIEVQLESGEPLLVNLAHVMTITPYDAQGRTAIVLIDPESDEVICASDYQEIYTLIRDRGAVVVKRPLTGD